ncbi:imidazole glycerol phosphate synthase subunit HisF [Candidatus Woesearchaeota archaeon]|jgi:imidazole glycerol-phosphate synthase subunit HisF|nr:imidazole glycerol phosphate synthase subunit HisF [Candidatus Woesearchaeota archaeon]MBT3538445.1 imidazole glycerol phosphate synthase subunit HisF [Candidatus Woesearchaeota archaeon]MBT4697008.1 imidazole glycerol phosphate synthase subunit HisF [Candidatus Woesearchaeota archaeon]MBT7931003.1 imidazole glycerol phosphate synthase subunit HisF [Candidatus Woesearchaeota archaeon]
MLKKRLIPCIVIRDNIIVQSIGFSRYLPVGKVEVAVEFFMKWDVDEIIVLDITATRDGRKPNIDLINFFTEKCFLPLTVGGGINSLEDIRNTIKAGADKVAINTAAITNPEIIQQGARVFGSQAIIVSMDIKKNSENKHEIYIDSGKKPTGLDPVDFAKKAASLGAGEIFVNSIDRDGMKNGYDLDLLRMISAAVNIPVIACGGVGKMQHFAEGIIDGRVSAVSAANIFQHIEQSTIIAKAFMKKAGIDVRLISKANYDDFEFDELGRVLKSPKIEEARWY